MKRRTLIRIISFTAALILVLGGLVLYQSRVAALYLRQLRGGYARALGDLTYHVAAMEQAMQRGSYTTSPASLVAVSNEVAEAAGAAKACLGELPLTAADLTMLERYLCQAGDYADILARKAAAGKPPAADEREAVDALYGYTRALSARLYELEGEYAASAVDFDYFAGSRPAATLLFSRAALPDVADAMGELMGVFEGYPELLYDGPYSSHLAGRESVYLAGQSDVTREEARGAAAAFLGIEAAALADDSDLGGALAAHCFTFQSGEICVTKAGGVVMICANERALGEPARSLEQGGQLAADFLTAQGYAGMELVASRQQGGMGLYSFAYRDGDILCYPDLIQVGIGLDRGDVVRYDATAYLMSHVDARGLKSGALGEGTLPEGLTAVSAGRAVIPTPGGFETLVTETCCTDADGAAMRFYEGAAGGEQRILTEENFPAGLF